MAPEERKSAYQRDGFILVHQFLPQDEMEELNTELDRYIREVVPALPVASAFYQERGNPNSLKQLQHMGCDPFFDRYRTRRRWVEMAQELVGEPVEANPPEWFNKPPATPNLTPPHQDNYYSCLRPPNAVTLWVGLDFVDESNGCRATCQGRTTRASDRMVPPRFWVSPKESRTGVQRTRPGKWLYD